MGSSISAARAALFDLLEADTGVLAGVQVTFGAPEAIEEAEVVSLGGVEDAEEDTAALGPMAGAEERFVVLVEVKVFDPVGDGPTVDARGWALADGVRAVVRANPTLGGAVREARIRSQLSDGAQPPVTTDGQQLAGVVIFVTVRIECRQRST